MSMIGFPLLLIPFAIYNIVVFLMQGVSFDAPLLALTLTSGKTWTATFSDGLLALGMLLLMVEVIKAAKPGAKYFTDHLLSLLVFAGAAAEFVMLPQFATSTFFLLTVLALVDFLASLAIRARRSATAQAPVKAGRRAAPAPEPKFEPSAATDLAPPVAAAPAEPVPPLAADEAQTHEHRDPAAPVPPQPR
jgi:predicted lipid-binding transport protein (Tim44 family)